MSPTSAKERVLVAYRYYERLVVLVLLGLLMIVVCYATVGLLMAIVVSIYEKLQAREFHLALPALHEVFAGFLTLLIGLELMKTIAMYLEDHLIHVEVVLTVAMIAIARHAIDVDYKTAPPLALIGIASIIIALSVGYYYFKKATGNLAGEAHRQNGESEDTQ